LTSLAIGCVSAGLLSLLYTLSDVPEAHVAIAIAVFIQFLFFTENVALGPLRVVSILLLVHVFFGTHMALGILKLYYRPDFDWYPAQPLESRFGLLTIGAMGLGLAWRSFGLQKIFYEVNQRFSTSEEYLKFLDYLCKLVNIYYFFGVAWYRLEQADSWTPPKTVAESAAS
jgi:hypothetical protein